MRRIHSCHFEKIDKNLSLITILSYSDPVFYKLIKREESCFGEKGSDHQKQRTLLYKFSKIT